MGLDMYLFARMRTYKSYGQEREHPVRQVIQDNLPEMFSSGNIETIEVAFEAGYWRKANQIHNWFVENVQSGNDNHGEYYVGREQLEELRDTCKRILDARICPEFSVTADESPNPVAEEELPTSQGFFFGSDDYDEWYYEDLEETISIIDECLKLPDDWDFYYHASW